MGVVLSIISTDFPRLACVHDVHLKLLVPLPELIVQVPVLEELALDLHHRVERPRIVCLALEPRRIGAGCLSHDTR